MVRPRTRLYLPSPLLPSPLARGADLRLEGARAHYLRTVLRMGVGDRVLAFNGTDGEWLAEVTRLDKAGGDLRALDQTRPPDPAEADGPWLLFAPLKAGRTETVVEKATELGAGRLLPVFTKRSDVTRVNLDRLQATALEAAEQCDRLTVPEVAPGADLFTALRSLAADRVVFAALESGAARPAATAMTEHRGQPAAVLVGPEGGFEGAELDALRHLPSVVPIGLGPRVLRGDTAAIAGLVLWGALAGDWTDGRADRRPPFRAA